MNAYELAGRRRLRMGVLLAAGAGWLAIATGAAVDEGAVIVAGAVVAGAANAVLAKLAFESRTAVEAARGDHRSGARALARTQSAVDLHEHVVGALRRDVVGLARSLSDSARSMAAADQRSAAADQRRDEEVGRLAGALDDTGARLGASLDDATARLAQLEQALASARQQQARLDEAQTTTLDAVALTRSMVDKLSSRVPSAVSADRLAALAHQRVEHPLLSIAIPSYNRPEMLAECLASVEHEIRGSFDDVVEVCILDDASPDPDTIEIAAAFVERCDFASLRRQPRNVALERNVNSACRRCRGEYVLILGNDDRMIPGALATIVADVRSQAAAVYLYGKTRITVDGRPRAAVEGSLPVDLAPGECERFASIFDAARRQGFLSTFGFTSHVIFRREPFVEVDPDPYLDLTLYAQVFALLEALGREPVLYRNVPIVFHRTPSQSHKIVESLGRRESTFMTGGGARSARYFGTTLAASWQRLIDRTGLDPGFLADQPERLMTPLPLLSWITTNRLIIPELDSTLDPQIVADGERFLSAFALESSA